MFHHDEREYNTAADAAVRAARDKLQGIIDKGLASAQAVIEDIQSRVLVDKVVRAPALSLMYDEDGDRALRLAGDEVYGIHDHCFDQLLANTKVGKDFYNTMVKEAADFFTPIGATPCRSVTRNSKTETGACGPSAASPPKDRK